MRNRVPTDDELREMAVREDERHRARELDRIVWRYEVVSPNRLDIGDRLARLRELPLGYLRRIADELHALPAYTEGDMPVASTVVESGYAAWQEDERDRERAELDASGIYAEMSW